MNVYVWCFPRCAFMQLTHLHAHLHPSSNGPGWSLTRQSVGFRLLSNISSSSHQPTVESLFVLTFLDGDETVSQYWHENEDTPSGLILTPASVTVASNGQKMCSSTFSLPLLDIYILFPKYSWWIWKPSPVGWRGWCVTGGILSSGFWVRQTER